MTLFCSSNKRVPSLRAHDVLLSFLQSLSSLVNRATSSACTVHHAIHWLMSAMVSTTVPISLMNAIAPTAQWPVKTWCNSITMCIFNFSALHSACLFSNYYAQMIPVSSGRSMTLKLYSLCQNIVPCGSRKLLRNFDSTS